MTPPNQDSDTRTMGRWMAAAAWVVLLVLLTALFSDVLEDQENPNRELSIQVGDDGRPEVLLTRNRQGHYVTPGFINGEPVVFLLDTGATGVAVPDAVAERIGLARGRPIMTQTANGAARSYLTRLEQVSVGPIGQRDVAATISPGLEGDRVLLGMSFLKNLELVQRGDTLTLRE